MRSLRRLTAVTFIGTALLLALLLITGFFRNRMMSEYSAIVDESESTIFFYATIREQATVGLLSKNPTQLLAAAREVEQLHGRYTNMLDNRLIPTQYKLSFLQKIDLEQIVILLKLMAEKPTDFDLALKIQSHLRQINNQFLQFDRIVISEMRNRVMRYQKSALVLMGFIILLTNFTLIMLYKKSVRPLITLAEQTNLAMRDKTSLQLSDEKKSSAEVRQLISSFNELLQTSTVQSSNTTPSRKEAEFSVTVNEVTNSLNGIINYSQLLADYFKAENVGVEQQKILYKIIENGEKGAEILQKTLHGGQV